MEEVVIVIMLKDSETGILERELGAYIVSENEKFIVNTYAVEGADGAITTYIKLTTDKDVADWEFSAIYDFYDTEILLSEVTDVEEVEDCFNPTWEVSFPFSEDVAEMEQNISKILTIHKNELLDVYLAIEEKSEEYNS